MWHIAKPQVRNVIRSRWLASYFAFFLLVSEGLLRFSGGDARSLLGLVNVVLFVVPMATLVYGIIFLYNSREFIELMLAQPIRRRTLFSALYAGLVIPLTAAVIAGMLIPFLYHGFGEGQRLSLALIIGGAGALTAVFTGIAFCVALSIEDRLAGVGAGLGIWLLLALVYDGALLFIVALSEQPLEKSLLVATLANPIDLVRIGLLLQFDVSALMGHTGAVFSSFFSGGAGLVMIAAALTAWIAIPVLGGFMAFKRKDF
jgi:Cu-processing system permease protein